MGINDSYGYTEQLQANAAQHRGSGLKGDVLLGAGAISFSHWLGNRRRKKMGLPQEPMSNTIGIPMAIGLGWIFWWVPFAAYMLLDVVFFHLHVFSFLATVAMFVGLFIAWKKRRNKKYSAYYTAKAAKTWNVAVKNPANIHAPGSSEWISEAGQRMRKNVGL